MNNDESITFGMEDLQYLNPCLSHKTFAVEKFFSYTEPFIWKGSRREISERVLNFFPPLWNRGVGKFWTNDLQKIRLCKTTLWRADLRRADLRGASISYSSVSYSDLRFADLRGAFLQNTNFIDSNLEGVDFSRSDLRYSDFYGAYTKGANFQDANLNGVIGLLDIKPF